QPVSTEITGYFASICVYLISQTGDPAYVDAARRAARFLTRVAWDEELKTFPYEYSHDPSADPPAYFFDCGIIIRGLLAAWRATGEAQFLRVARTCGRSMGGMFMTEDGIHPVISLPGSRPVPPGGRWSTAPGCYQLKSALAWHDLSVPTGNKKYLAYYRKALEHAAATHETFVPGSDDQLVVMDRLHAYCYFLEGLLPCASQESCATHLGNGIRRTAQWLRDIAPVFARSDVYAQLVRLRLYAAALGVSELDEEAAREEIAVVEGFQLESGDNRVDGGFCFGRKGGELMPYVNPVSTAFCLQALLMWEQYERGQFRADPSVLV
ncbi:MAG: hypothetical protein GY953_07840, partial [bacterium]|nr:hypothetical protein [bacterium]